MAMRGRWLWALAATGLAVGLLVQAQTAADAVHAPKGEYVLVVAGAEPVEAPAVTLEDAVAQVLALKRIIPQPHGS